MSEQPNVDQARMKRETDIRNHLVERFSSSINELEKTHGDSKNEPGTIDPEGRDKHTGLIIGRSICAAVATAASSLPDNQEQMADEVAQMFFDMTTGGITISPEPDQRATFGKAAQGFINTPESQTKIPNEPWEVSYRGRMRPVLQNNGYEIRTVDGVVDEKDNLDLPSGYEVVDKTSSK